MTRQPGHSVSCLRMVLLGRILNLSLTGEFRRDMFCRGTATVISTMWPISMRSVLDDLSMSYLRLPPECPDRRFGYLPVLWNSVRLQRFGANLCRTARKLDSTRRKLAQSRMAGTSRLEPLVATDSSWV